jgi:hypothetical protein
LNAGRTIDVELPEFLIRAEEANVGASDQETVSLEDAIEWCVASPRCVDDIPELEKAVPGFTDALNAWLLQTGTYGPQK